MLEVDPQSRNLLQTQGLAVTAHSGLIVVSYHNTFHHTYQYTPGNPILTNTHTQLHWWIKSCLGFKSSDIDRQHFAAEVPDTQLGLTGMASGQSTGAAGCCMELESVVGYQDPCQQAAAEEMAAAGGAIQSWSGRDSSMVQAGWRPGQLGSWNWADGGPLEGQALDRPVDSGLELLVQGSTRGQQTMGLELPAPGSTLPRWALGSPD